jgi:serralysin
MAIINSTYNAAGVLLKASVTPTRGFSIASGVTTISGSTGADLFRSNGGGTTMTGGAGDDSYYIYSTKDNAVESANGGVDTVYSTVNWKLGDNFENLQVDGNNTWGIGNSLNNIIAASSGTHWMDGGLGNDILIGGTGTDTFVHQGSQGMDLIINFTCGTDKLRLMNTGLTGFDSIKSKMMQVGNDVVIKIGTNDSVTLANHKISDFTANDITGSLNKSNLKLTFADEFNSLSLYNGTSGSWSTSYGYGGAMAKSNRTLNDEAQVYTDANWRGTDGKMTPINPFSISNGILNITETKLTAAQSASNWGLQYSSGLLTTKSTFSQLYGYFEVNTKLPAGQGMWPAFWLLPANGTWPPELDVFEQLGKDPSTIYMTAHTSANGKYNESLQSVVYVSDVTQNYHTYGVLWTATDLVWYLDGNVVAKTATPGDMHSPMYMLLNLAVGGGWGGGTNGTPDTATMQVDYVHAYSISETTTTAQAQAALTSTGAITATGLTDIAQNLANGTMDHAIKGGLGADIIKATDESDYLIGGSGNDTFVITKSVLDSTMDGSGVQKVIADFEGANTWAANSNDILLLNGFSAGSTMSWIADDPSNGKLGYYDIHDAASGADYLIGILSTNGQHLALSSDFKFY